MTEAEHAYCLTCGRTAPNHFTHCTAAIPEREELGLPEHLTHDYRRRYWGHNITWTSKDSGQVLTGLLWFHGTIVEGDYLLMPNNTDHGSRYRVTKIKRLRDPDDMFSFEASFAPRTEAPL